MKTHISSVTNCEVTKHRDFEKVSMSFLAFLYEYSAAKMPNEDIQLVRSNLVATVRASMICSGAYEVQTGLPTGRNLRSGAPSFHHSTTNRPTSLGEGGSSI